ncbi:DegT/DnrJ/EryC1/StrS family aminotransferase [Candidatus Uhrbacteria bacterium]|nr:DegT/DnrJ/EryC1/StrS family aminotransferase [Candidatus Uhrbacteria bacterium]
MNIPLVNLRAQYASLRGELDGAAQRVFLSGNFVLGPEVQKFENDFAAYCGTKYAVGVNSGTSALHLALLAMGCGPGAEVITQPNSFFATAEAVSLTGAKPVFVDVNPETHQLDASKLEEAITPVTKVVIPVHLFGAMGEMDKILDVARRHGLLTLEDAAQAHGASFKGKKAGSWGDAAAFSFYPGKNLGAYGEGGAVVTSNGELAEAVRLLRDHGSKQKYIHEIIGFNMRLEALQGAILNIKLPHLDEWNEKRRELAKKFDAAFVGLPIETVKNTEGCVPVYHLYIIKTKEREQLQAYLAERGVATGIHYPIPIHLQRAYAHLGLLPGSYPFAEKLSKEIVSLPIYPELGEPEQAHIIEKIRAFFRL